MEQKRGLILVLAILFLSIMLANIPINPLREAFALQQVDFLPVVTATMVVTTQYTIGGSNLQYFVQVGKVGTSNYIEVYNATNYNTLSTTNITGSIGATGKTLQGISCSQTHAMCALAYRGSAGSDRVFLFDAKNAITQSLSGGRNFTANNIDSVIYTDVTGCGAVGGCNQVFVTYRNAHAGDAFIDNYQTVEPANAVSFQSSPFIFGYTYDTGFVIDFQQSKMGFFNTTNSAGSTQQFIGEASASTQLFTVINIGARSTKCQVGLAGATDTGDIVYANDTINGLNSVNGLDWFVSAGASVNTFFKFDNSCNLKSTINSAGIVGTNYPISGLSYSSSRHEIYAYLGQARNQTVVINATNIPATPTQTSVLGQYTLKWDSGGILINTVATSTASGGVIAIAEASLGHIHFIYWGQAGQGAGSPPPSSSGQQTFVNAAGQTCVNIYDSTGTVLITTYCSTSNSGGKIVSPNTISSINTGSNITTLGNVLGCGLGLTSCTNSNIQTNGVGLFLLLILIVFSYALLVGIHYKAVELHSGRGNVQAMQILAINPMLLLIMLIVDVGIAFFVNWIGGVIFYTMVAAIAGLTTFGIYRHVKGDSS